MRKKYDNRRNIILYKTRKIKIGYKKFRSIRHEILETLEENIREEEDSGFREYKL